MLLKASHLGIGTGIAYLLLVFHRILDLKSGVISIAALFYFQPFPAEFPGDLATPLFLFIGIISVRPSHKKSLILSGSHPHNKFQILFGECISRGIFQAKRQVVISR
jgi:hypothetical protein